MDYLIVFALGFIGGVFACSKITEIRKEKAKSLTRKKRESEVITIQGKQYVPKKTKGKARV